MWDHDTVNQDDFMGQVMIPLREIPLTAPMRDWFQLMRRSVKDKVEGAILLEIQLMVDKKQVPLDLIVAIVTVNFVWQMLSQGIFCSAYDNNSKMTQ